MTRTDAPEIIRLAGREWVRIPHTSDGLESIDQLGAPVKISESRLRRIEDDERAAAAKRAAEQERADRERAEFDARPRVVIDGVEWVRDLADPALLISVSTGAPVVMRERQVRDLAAQREHEAQLQAAQSAPSPVEQRITELEAQLAALRAGTV